MPRITISGQRKQNFQRDASMRAGTIKGCIDPSVFNEDMEMLKKSDDYYLRLR